MKVVKFKDFEITNETTYKVDADGNMVAQKWASYQDYYPEKYGEFKDMDISYVWVITKDDEKVAVFSADVPEEMVRSVVETLKNNDSENEDEDELEFDDEHEFDTENEVEDMSLGEVARLEGRSNTTD